LKPTFGKQPLDAVEFTKIACDDDQALAAGVTGNEQVVGVDRLAVALESGANFRGVGGGKRAKSEDCETGGKAFDLLPVMRGAGGFFSAVQQLRQRDG